MSQRTQHGAIGVALTALAVAAPLLLLGGPSAARPRDSGHEVVFTGRGMLGVTCAAAASRSAITVPAESTVRVVNRTGNRARLLLNGAARGHLGHGQSTEILFHRGPVALALAPTCVMGGRPATVPVVVVAPSGSASTAPGGAGTAPSPAPSTSASASATPRPTQSSARPVPTVTVDESPSRQPRERDRPQPGSTFGPAPATAVPSRRPARATPRPTEASAEPAATVPTATEPTEEETPAIAVPATPRPTDRAGRQQPLAEQDAAEPVVAMVTVSGTGPFGLLALVATICLIGTAFGAIRTILSERASRTKIA